MNRTRSTSKKNNFSVGPGSISRTLFINEKKSPVVDRSSGGAAPQLPVAHFSYNQRFPAVSFGRYSSGFFWVYCWKKKVHVIFLYFFIFFYIHKNQKSKIKNQKLKIKNLNSFVRKQNEHSKRSGARNLQEGDEEDL